MKVKCISCGHELNLDHWVFDDYAEPVKCFSCSRWCVVSVARSTGRDHYDFS